MSQLKTDWVRIATEGNTFRNVPIERQWLVDIAETYNVETYSARIWPEHRRWYGAWGDVLEVKTEENDEEKLVLYGRLSPNAQLVQANEQDQKVFTSIEVDPDFAKSGKAYLTGLGVTDEPASLGTERLKFATKERFDTHQYGAPEQLVISYAADKSDEEPKQGKQLYSLLKKFFTSNSPDLASDTSEEEPMNKEQFALLTGQLESFGARIGDIETQIKAFSTVTPAEEELAPGATVTTETTNAEITKQFGTLNELITGLTNKVEGMETKFTALSAEGDGQEPDPAGLGDSISFI